MLAYRETLLRIAIQEAAKQNLATYARAPMLDHLGALTGAVRLPAQSARTMVEFALPPAETTIVIPAGTEISSSDGDIVFITAAVCALTAGQTTVSVWAEATVPGGALNGITPGQLTGLTTPPAAGMSARNTTTSYGGSDAETDDHFRLRVMLSPERDACGTVSAYRLAALSAHPDILDVAVTSEAPGVVTVSAATATGAPDEGLLDLLRTLLNAETFKPLTDRVIVIAPKRVPFVVEMQLILLPGAPAATSAAVQQALEGYAATLRKTLGRDLTPSRFITLAQNTPGVQGVVIIRPTETSLTDHQYADCTAISITVSGVNNG